MNMNDAVSAQNRELVYRAADWYFNKHNEIPRQVHIMTRCPGMSKQTAKKYRKEWLGERNLIAESENLSKYSPRLQQAFDDEVRDRKAIDHKKIHDEVQNLDEQNEILMAENDHLSTQLQDSSNEANALKERLAFLEGQSQTRGEQIGKLEALLTEAASNLKAVQEQHEIKTEKLLQAEREALDREQLAKAKIQDLETSNHLVQSESLLAKILEKALDREQWFADQFSTAQEKVAKSKGASPRNLATSAQS